MKLQHAYLCEPVWWTKWISQTRVKVPTKKKKDCHGKFYQSFRLTRREFKMRHSLIGVKSRSEENELTSHPSRL